MVWTPVLTRSFDDCGLSAITLGHDLVDEYLVFAGARLRLNSWLAVAFDLKVFFTQVDKEPPEVTTADVFSFISAQRSSRLGPKVVRIEDGDAGMSARTIKRRLASVSGLFAYLVARGDTSLRSNPVPRGTPTRRAASRPGRWAQPLIRTPGTLPRVLAPAEIDAFVAALRTRRDRAIIEAMLLGGLRRCEVLGLRLVDINAGERRLFISQGKGGHQRIVPVSGRFFATLADYLAHERPETDTEQVFVVLKGQRRGRPLSAYGIDEIVAGARGRAGIRQLTCHQLRHTCMTSLNRGMPLEAIAALLGHKTLTMTLVYARIADRTVADEYFAVSEKVEALYDRPRELPADAEGAEMRKLRGEMHRRMLGNGYCARPVEMDCHFESICESCSFFVTTIEFKPTLQRQRDDAAAKGQVGRERIFDGLLRRLDGEAS